MKTSDTAVVEHHCMDKADDIEGHHTRGKHFGGQSIDFVVVVPWDIVESGEGFDNQDPGGRADVLAQKNMGYRVPLVVVIHLDSNLETWGGGCSCLDDLDQGDYGNLGCQTQGLNVWVETETGSRFVDNCWLLTGSLQTDWTMRKC